MYNLITDKWACITQARYGSQRKTITIRVILLICTSNLAYLGLLDRISCLALNQIELSPPTGGLWYWELNMTKQNTQPKTRDNYCPHLNPLHRETLLSLHLKYELLRMAHKVTGTGHPFLQKIGKGQAITWQAMPYMTGYTRLLQLKRTD